MLHILEKPTIYTGEHLGHPDIPNGFEYDILPGLTPEAVSVLHSKDIDM
jgi:hypothetical protein